MAQKKSNIEQPSLRSKYFSRQNSLSQNFNEKFGGKKFSLQMNEAHQKLDDPLISISIVDLNKPKNIRKIKINAIACCNFFHFSYSFGFKLELFKKLKNKSLEKRRYEFGLNKPHMSWFEENSN